MTSTNAIQTVKFNDDADKDVTTTSLPQALMDSSILQSSRQEGRDHSISDILGRPVLINTGTFTVTDTTNSILWSAVIPEVFLTTENVAKKVGGNTFIRGTLHTKVVVNAQKMQQGRATLGFFPEMDAARKYQMDQTLITRTQRPRVDIDINSMTDVTLTLPYISPYLGYNFANGTGSMGGLSLWVYSPLVSPTGPTKVDFTIYMWMTDVELQYPTFVAQCLRDEVFEAQVLGSSSGTKRGERSAVEGKDTGSGMSLSKLVSVPLVDGLAGKLSALAGLPEWASVLLKGGAMAMGWSKPIGDFMTSRVESGVFAHTNHSDGTTFARNMGITSHNHVQVYPGFAGQDVDEMSINYMCSIPTYHGTYQWTVEQATTKIIEVNITPSTFEYPVDLWTYRSPFNYLAQFFQMWRGSIMLHFKLVKTEFHSGRLMVVWTPGGSISTITQAQYCYTEILDIRETNDYSITIPYVSNQPYIRKNMNGTYARTGTVSVWVLNALSAPANVAQAISVIVESCACSDTEFAGPVRPLCFPVAPGSGLGGMGLMKAQTETLEEEEVFQAQSGRQVVWPNQQTPVLSYAPGMQAALVSVPAWLRDNSEYRQIPLHLHERMKNEFVDSTLLNQMHWQYVTSLKDFDWKAYLDPYGELIEVGPCVFAKVNRRALIKAFHLKYRASVAGAWQSRMMANQRMRDAADALVQMSQVFTAQCLLDHEEHNINTEKHPNLHVDVWWQLIYQKVDRADVFLAMQDEFKLAQASDKYVRSCTALVSIHHPWPYKGEAWTDFFSVGPEGPGMYCTVPDYLLWLYTTTGLTVELLADHYVKGGTPQNLHISEGLMRQRPISNKGAKFTKREKSRSSSRTPSTPSSPPRGKSLSPKGRQVVEEIFTAQVLGENTCTDDQSATVASPDQPICSSIMSSNVSNATHCVGERITSIKQLLLRHTAWLDLASLAGGATFRFRTPFFSGVEASGNTVSRMPTSMDYLNLFAPLFAFFRGSMRYNLYSTTNTNVNGTWRISHSNPDTQMGNNLTATVATADVAKMYNQSYNTALAHNVTAGGIEFQVPFYSHLPSQRVHINQGGDSVPRDYENMISLRNTGSSVIVIQRAAGDDFQFGLFVGVPPTIYTFGLVGTTGSTTW